MTTLAAKDALGVTQQIAVVADGSGNLTPVHLEDASQRSALLAMFSPLATAALQTANTNGIVAAINSAATATQPVSLASLPLPIGAATDASLVAIKTALGTPLQAGGAVTVSGVATAANQTTGNTSLAAIQAALAKPGVGDLTAVPAGSTNGTLIGTKPGAAKKVRLYLPAGASVSFTIAGVAPSSAPSAVFTASATNTGPNWDEELADAENVYVTAVSGSALFRYI